MNTFIIIFIVLMSIYALIWAYLLVGYFRGQALAISYFKAAWDESNYNVQPTRNYALSKTLLRIGFPVNQSRQYVDVDTDGKLVSAIIWDNDSSRKVSPNRYTRKCLEEYTQQIATMYKLENDFSVSDFDNDDSQTSAGL